MGREHIDLDIVALEHCSVLAYSNVNRIARTYYAPRYTYIGLG